MELKLARGEVLLRVLAVMVLVATACLVAFDTQTKVIFLTITKKATYKDMDALKGLVYVTSAAAGYNLVQLGKLSVSAYSGADGKGSYDTNNNIYMAWITFLLDQVLVYMTVVANTGALEASLVAKNGVEEFQWVKVCNRFGRFCLQIGGALLCGYAASIIMALISTVSAYHVFRMYSPKRFLRFKPRSSIAPSSSSS